LEDEPMNAPASRRHVRLFDDLTLDDVAEVGGKVAALGELRRCLPAGIVHVPAGFAVTATAFRSTLDAADGWPRLHQVFDGLDRRDTERDAEGSDGQADDDGATEQVLLEPGTRTHDTSRIRSRSRASSTRTPRSTLQEGHRHAGSVPRRASAELTPMAP
jgi:hypothetical protein